MRIHVQGGTGAGSKKSLFEKQPEWECSCRVPSYQSKVPGGLATRDLRPKKNPGWLANCPDCKMRRP